MKTHQTPSAPKRNLILGVYTLFMSTFSMAYCLVTILSQA